MKRIELEPAEVFELRVLRDRLEQERWHAHQAETKAKCKFGAYPQLTETEREVDHVLPVLNKIIKQVDA